MTKIEEFYGQEKAIKIYSNQVDTNESLFGR